MQFIFQNMKNYFLFLLVLDSKNSKDILFLCATVSSPVLTLLDHGWGAEMFTSQFS